MLHLSNFWVIRVIHNSFIVRSKRKSNLNSAGGVNKLSMQLVLNSLEYQVSL